MEEWSEDPGKARKPHGVVLSLYVNCMGIGT